VQHSLRLGGTSDICSQLVKLFIKDNFFVYLFQFCCVNNLFIIISCMSIRLKHVFLD
jgi:hypothetical protein